MVSIITEYKSPAEFAKEYNGKFGKRLGGVNRTQITKLINKEIAEPGTTGIDVIIVGASRFVRHSPKKDTIEDPQQQAEELIKLIITRIGE